MKTKSPISISINPCTDSCAEPRYFTFRELTYTAQSIDNHPSTFTEVCNLRALAEFLDEIRDEFGYPIFVNSAFRTAEVNAAVGGAPRSLHKQGRAADIWCTEMRIDDLIDVLRKHRNQLSELIVNKDKHYIHIAL